jgi:uncharacterized repeat protein (TIGR03837 family)
MTSSVKPRNGKADLPWVIFCRVIDNLGDAGVCWRLAQQLSHEFGKKIELVIDRPELLQNFGFNYQEPSDIKITPWLTHTVPSVGAVTISAFACELPTEYLRNMLTLLNQQGFEKRRYWFNLEYLSAQDWVESHHLLNSTKSIEQSNASKGQSIDHYLTETFFFPGFTKRTGGLIREQFIVNRRHQRQALRRQFTIDENSLAISLFCYPNAAIARLCSALLKYSRQQPVHLILTVGLVLPVELTEQLRAHPNFKVQTLAFVNQREYDHLLRACDLNFVRGEDSLVRAIWAKNPFIWQAYPQDQATQKDKLDALLGHHFDSNYLNQFKALFLAWNFPQDKDGGDLEMNLQKCLENRSIWQVQTEIFCDRLCQQPDLAAQLVAASV